MLSSVISILMTPTAHEFYRMKNLPEKKRKKPQQQPNKTLSVQFSTSAEI